MRHIERVRLHLEVHRPGHVIESLAHAARSDREENARAIVAQDEGEIRREPPGLRCHAWFEIAQCVDAPHRVTAEDRADVVRVGPAGH